MFALDKKLLAGAVGIVLLVSACSSGTSSTTGYGTSPAAAASDPGGGGYRADRGYGTGTSDTGGKTASIDGQDVTVYGTADASGKASVAVSAESEGGANYFSPTIISGTPGEQVQIKVTNESSSVPHNFSVDGQDVNVDLDPGSTQTVTVTIPDSGTATFFCEYHRAGGMVGELKSD